MQPEALFPTPPDPRIPRLQALLLERYGPPPARDPWDPLTQFIYSLLSSRTKTEESQQVMRDLRARFANWEELRDASIEDMERTIAVVTFPEVKAPAAQARADADYRTLRLADAGLPRQIPHGEDSRVARVV